MSPHSIVHVELSAKDSKAAGKFYADIFGWKVESWQDSDYVTFETEPDRGGGFNTIDKDHKAGEVIPYILVDDIDAMLAKIKSQGGKIVQVKTEIGGVGHYGLFEDASGNRLGLYSS
jgi:predicted enzyme related to lactoylglutathione lyase